MWKQVKNTGSSLFFRRQDLPHHMITVYKGDFFTWWSPDFYNISYVIKLGASHRNICVDIIVDGIDNMYKIVEVIKNLSLSHDYDNLEAELRSNELVLAVGEHQYRDRANNGMIDTTIKKPVVQPYIVKQKTEDDVAFGLAQAIRQMMRS